jgi:hypothetical protein
MPTCLNCGRGGCRKSVAESFLREPSAHDWVRPETEPPEAIILRVETTCS